MGVIIKTQVFHWGLEQLKTVQHPTKYSFMQNLQLNYENRISKVTCRIHPKFHVHLVGNKEFQSWGRKETQVGRNKEAINQKSQLGKENLTTNREAS